MPRFPLVAFSRSQAERNNRTNDRTLQTIPVDSTKDQRTRQSHARVGVATGDVAPNASGTFDLRQGPFGTPTNGPEQRTAFNASTGTISTGDPVLILWTRQQQSSGGAWVAYPMAGTEPGTGGGAAVKWGLVNSPSGIVEGSTGNVDLDATVGGGTIVAENREWRTQWNGSTVVVVQDAVSMAWFIVAGDSADQLQGTVSGAPGSFVAAGALGTLDTAIPVGGFFDLTTVGFRNDSSDSLEGGQSIFVHHDGVAQSDEWKTTDTKRLRVENKSPGNEVWTPTYLKFEGSGVTLVNDGPSGRTTATITGGTGGVAVEDEGSDIDPGSTFGTINVVGKHAVASIGLPVTTADFTIGREVRLRGILQGDESNLNFDEIGATTPAKGHSININAKPDPDPLLEMEVLIPTARRIQRSGDAELAYRGHAVYSGNAIESITNDATTTTFLTNRVHVFDDSLAFGTREFIRFGLNLDVAADGTGVTVNATGSTPTSPLSIADETAGNVVATSVDLIVAVGIGITAVGPGPQATLTVPGQKLQQEGSPVDDPEEWMTLNVAGKLVKSTSVATEVANVTLSLLVQSDSVEELADTGTLNFQGNQRQLANSPVDGRVDVAYKWSIQEGIDPPVSDDVKNLRVTGADVLADANGNAQIIVSPSEISVVVNSVVANATTRTLNVNGTLASGAGAGTSATVTLNLDVNDASAGIASDINEIRFPGTTVTKSGDAAIVTIPTGSLVFIEDNGSPQGSVDTLDFVDGVSATVVGSTATINSFIVTYENNNVSPILAETKAINLIGSMVTGANNDPVANYTINLDASDDSIGTATNVNEFRFTGATVTQTGDRADINIPPGTLTVTNNGSGPITPVSTLDLASRIIGTDLTGGVVQLNVQDLDIQDSVGATVTTNPDHIRFNNSATVIDGTGVSVTPAATVTIQDDGTLEGVADTLNFDVGLKATVTTGTALLSSHFATYFQSSPVLSEAQALNMIGSMVTSSTSAGILQNYTFNLDVSDQGATPATNVNEIRFSGATVSQVGDRVDVLIPPTAKWIIQDSAFQVQNPLHTVLRFSNDYLVSDGGADVFVDAIRLIIEEDGVLFENNTRTINCGPGITVTADGVDRVKMDVTAVPATITVSGSFPTVPAITNVDTIDFGVGLDVTNLTGGDVEITGRVLEIQNEGSPQDSDTSFLDFTSGGVEVSQTAPGSAAVEIPGTRIDGGGVTLQQTDIIELGTNLTASIQAGTFPDRRVKIDAAGAVAATTMHRATLNAPLVKGSTASANLQPSGTPVLASWAWAKDGIGPSPIPATGQTAQPTEIFLMEESGTYYFMGADCHP